MKITRHVGIDAKNNAQLSLLMPLLEGSNDCLVIYVDSLPRELKDAYLHILQSDEGQRQTDLSKAMATRLYSDTGMSLLQTLHAHKFIRKVSIDDVIMTPSPAYKIPLRQVLTASGLMKENIDNQEVDKFNPHKHNADAAVNGQTTGTARNLLIEADLLEQTVREKREQAYRMAPELRPAAVAEAAPVAEELPITPDASVEVNADISATAETTISDIASEFTKAE